MQLKYIVTGNGRCGSVWMAKTLSNCGINCGHETIFSYDNLENAKKRLNGKLSYGLSEISKSATGQNEVNWFPTGMDLQADSSYMAAPFLDDPLFKNTSIIHLVRDPMQVINSFLEGFGYFRDSCLQRLDESRYHNFIYRHVPRVIEFTLPVDRAAAFYIEWNKMIEAKSKNRRYFRFNINNKHYDKLSKFLGIELINVPKRKINERHSKNKFNHVSQINSAILRKEIMELYVKYCYIKI